RRARLAAELLGPGQRQPAVLAPLRDGLAVDVATPHLAVACGQRLGTRRRHEFGEVGPQFAAQLLLLWGVADPHRHVLTLLGIFRGITNPSCGPAFTPGCNTF